MKCQCFIRISCYENHSQNTHIRLSTSLLRILSTPPGASWTRVCTKLDRSGRAVQRHRLALALRRGPRIAGSRDPADQVGFGHFLFQLRQHLEHPVTNQVAIGPNLYYQPGSWYDLEWFSFTVSTSAGSAESLRTGCCTVAGTGSTTQAIGANRRGERSDARPTSEKIMRDVDGEGDAQGAA